jgi:hypothetical protein
MLIHARHYFTESFVLQSFQDCSEFCHLDPLPNNTLSCFIFPRGNSRASGGRGEGAKEKGRKKRMFILSYDPAPQR